MVRAVDPYREFSGVHPDDEKLPEHERTVFRWTGLDVIEERHVQDRLTALAAGDDGAGDQLVSKRGSLTYWRLKFGLRPPERFVDAHGAPVVWTEELSPLSRGGKMVPTDSYLSRIPLHVRNWLAARIGEATMLTEADAGKSSRPSTSPSGASSPTAEPAASPAAAS